jgi:hypothetical protein
VLKLSQWLSKKSGTKEVKVEADILGTKYTIVFVPENKQDYDGICDTSIKQITVVEIASDGTDRVKKNLDYVKNKILRHEIIHAFIYESGLDSGNALDEEQIVDWIAVQSPKLFEIFRKLSII